MGKMGKKPKSTKSKTGLQTTDSAESLSTRTTRAPVPGCMKEGEFLEVSVYSGRPDTGSLKEGETLDVCYYPPRAEPILFENGEFLESSVCSAKLNTGSLVNGEFLEVLHNGVPLQKQKRNRSKTREVLEVSVHPARNNPDSVDGEFLEGSDQSKPKPVKEKEICEFSVRKHFQHDYHTDGPDVESFSMDTAISVSVLPQAPVYSGIITPTPIQRDGQRLSRGATPYGKSCPTGVRNMQKLGYEGLAAGLDGPEISPQYFTQGQPMPHHHHHRHHHHFNSNRL